MKISRVVVIVLVVVIVAILVLAVVGDLFGSSPSSAEWSRAANYPLSVSGALGVAGPQCVNGTVYVYCIGGQDALGGPRSNVYTSSAVSSSSPNITGWTSDASSYPSNIDGQACVGYSGYVYCSGGTFNDAGDDVASSYYAKLGSGGAVGNWTQTTAFPIPIDSQYCVAALAHIYCVGGNNETDGTNADSTASNSVWYAALSSSGIGAWSATTSYPANLYFPSCFASGGYIYCIGGADVNDNAQSQDYYAALSPNGVGAWTKTTAYPLQASGQACGFSSGYIYCVGGQEGTNPASYTRSVYYASVSSGGIGAWKQGGYPVSVGTTCGVLSGYVYCVGGFISGTPMNTDAVYYAPASSISSPTTSG